MNPVRLAEVHARCFTVPRPWRAAEFADLLAEDQTILVGDVAGFALGRVIADEAEVLTIAVAPERRRKGVARHLLADLEDAARRRGADTCFLEVAADNRAAIGLYHSAGYAEVGRRRGYYRKPDGKAVDALILSRVLTGA